MLTTAAADTAATTQPNRAAIRADVPVEMSRIMREVSSETIRAMTRVKTPAPARAQAVNAIEGSVRNDCRGRIWMFA